MPLNNFGMIGPGIYRGAQPDDHGIDILVALGVTCILKLNHADEAPPTRRAEIVEWHLPMNMTPLPEETTRKLVQDMAAIVEQGGVIFVHCTHGRDRTGFVAAAYGMLALKQSLEAVLFTRAEHGVDNRVSELTNMFFTHALKEFTEDA